MPGVSISRQFSKADKSFWNALSSPLEAAQPEISQQEPGRALGPQILSFLARTEEEALAALLNDDGSKSPRCLCTESFRELVNVKALVVGKDADEICEVVPKSTDTDAEGTAQSSVSERSQPAPRMQPKGMARLAGVSFVGAADGMLMAAVALLL